MGPKQITPYEYRPLHDGAREIRLVELLPGKFDDDVRVQIHHTTLVESLDTADTRMTITELAETLPSGWTVARTLDGRYLFMDTEENTSWWKHPDESVETAAYELPTNHESLGPHYEALSYVWGSDKKPYDIIVEGGRACTQLPITNNLKTALRHLQRPNESRRLWIDAICINQNDPVELGSQVQRMGRIYKLAYRVVVWLGTQSEHSDHALATLDHIGSQLEIDGEDGTQYPAPLAEERTWYEDEAALPYNQHTWDTILALLWRPWFERVWIVQEIQLGSRRPGPIFQCGMETIQFNKLYPALACLERKSDLSIVSLSPELAHLVTNAEKLLEPMPGLQFPDILRSGAIGRSCEDGRDRVYGILGLLPQRFASKIKVDYGINKTPSQVYQETFVIHARHVERLELFPDLTRAALRFPEAPSWVPNWDLKSPGENYHTTQFATGPSRAHLKYTDKKPGLLEVLGVYCAVVSHVSDYLPEGLRRQDAMDRIRHWQPCDLDDATYTPTGESLGKAYACILIENMVEQRFPGFLLISMDKWIEQVGDGSLFDDNGSSRGRRDASHSMKMKAAVIWALGNCAGRAFFQTREGYMGLCPAETRPGDVVALFLGCSNPLILRPQEGRFSVVGDSFVHGLDDAIKLLGPLPEPWRVIRPGSSRRFDLHYFFNAQTGETTREDPRLEPLHDWVRIDRKPDGDDPIECDFFEHQETGEVVNYDPRLEPEMLEKRGVQLRNFILV